VVRTRCILRMGCGRQGGEVAARGGEDTRCAETGRSSFTEGTAQRRRRTPARLQTCFSPPRLCMGRKQSALPPQSHRASSISSSVRDGKTVESLLVLDPTTLTKVSRQPRLGDGCNTAGAAASVLLLPAPLRQLSFPCCQHTSRAVGQTERAGAEPAATSARLSNTVTLPRPADDKLEVCSQSCKDCFDSGGHAKIPFLP